MSNFSETLGFKKPNKSTSGSVFDEYFDIEENNATQATPVTVDPAPAAAPPPTGTPQVDTDTTEATEDKPKKKSSFKEWLDQPVVSKKEDKAPEPKKEKKPVTTPKKEDDNMSNNATATPSTDNTQAAPAPAPAIQQAVGTINKFFPMKFYEEIGEKAYNAAHGVPDPTLDCWIKSYVLSNKALCDEIIVAAGAQAKQQEKKKAEELKFAWYYTAKPDTPIEGKEFKGQPKARAAANAFDLDFEADFEPKLFVVDNDGEKVREATADEIQEVYEKAKKKKKNKAQKAKDGQNGGAKDSAKS